MKKLFEFFVSLALFVLVYCLAGIVKVIFKLKKG